jgi:23S rRNA (cytosine1962-C5)-methyltransferase
VVRGHPWIFADRIRDQNRPGVSGDIAALYDTRNRFLGLGLYDPESPLRVRVLHAGDPVQIDAAWWRERLERAVSRRAGLRESGTTTGFRWIHGESDGWPGMVLDRYGETLVLKLYTTAWLRELDRWVGLIGEVLRPASVVLRLSRNVASSAERTHGLRDGDCIAGAAVEGPVVFLENGLRFEADPARGQKTGFFLDQRENRARLRSLARGADVLNAFSFSGGFSVYAAAGGARSVVDLDISGHALESSRRNFKLNEECVGATRHSCAQGDAFEWLAAREGGNFDVVVLDPPSMARKEGERAGAIRAYSRLARFAAARLRAGGLLLAASCSAHVPASDFFEATREGVRAAGRRFHELETTGHPVDHPAGFPEAHYLKAIYLRFG